MRKALFHLTMVTTALLNSGCSDVERSDAASTSPSQVVNRKSATTVVSRPTQAMSPQSTPAPWFESKVIEASQSLDPPEKKRQNR